MKNYKLPILIVIPHGGLKVPDELSGYEDVDEFNIFMNSDACVNEIFSFNERTAACINTTISRLFIDVDRSHLDLPPLISDGVIKSLTLDSKRVFKKDHFPDDLAIPNILKRYYFPFHEAVEKIIKTREIKLILECHTMLPVGPDNSADSGMPRPIISVDNRIYTSERTTESSTYAVANLLIDSLKRTFGSEEEAIGGKIKLNDPRFEGYIMAKYGSGSIPMLKISISRSLFLNEKYFSFEFLKVDELRISKLKERIWEAIEKFYKKL